MASTTITRPSAHVGFGVATAGLAGFVGLALAIAVAASMLFSPSVARFDSEPGYRDHGLRHPAVVAPAEQYPDKGLRDRPAVIAPAGDSLQASNQVNDSKLDDYGIRCVANGWCSQPASSNGHR